MPKKKIHPGNNHPKNDDAIQKGKSIEAHEQADKDIEQDPDLNAKSNPEDDLDEGELARLEGED